MKNKMFYRYANGELCSIATAGQKELKYLLVLHDFPIGFDSEFVKFIFKSDAPVSEKMEKAKYEINKMTEAHHERFLNMIDKCEKDRADRQAWKDTEKQRVEYNKQQQEQRDRKIEQCPSSGVVFVFIIFLVWCAYLYFGVNK